MKVIDLIFFRHGIADDSSPDHARALTEEGIRKTRAAAEGLKTMAMPIEKIFTSPWLRASQTAAIVSEILNLPDPLVMQELAGDRSAGDIVKAIQQNPGRCLLLVGHQPVLGDTIARLIGADGKCEIDLRKSGACAIQVDAFPPRKPAVLKWLLSAKQLRAAGK
jgi:phosphohistidine phosphatase